MRGAIEQWRDAAEFEARVTEKMAGGEPFCPPSSEPVKCAWDIWGESYEKDFSERLAKYCVDDAEKECPLIDVCPEGSCPTITTSSWREVAHRAVEE